MSRRGYSPRDSDDKTDIDELQVVERQSAFARLRSVCAVAISRVSAEPTQLYLRKACSETHESPLAHIVCAPSEVLAADFIVCADAPVAFPGRVCVASVTLSESFISACFGVQDAFDLIEYYLEGRATLRGGPATSSECPDVRLPTAVNRVRGTTDLKDTLSVLVAVPSTVPALHSSFVYLDLSTADGKHTVTWSLINHTHTPTCNHLKAPQGSVYAASLADNITALCAALAAGESTEEGVGVSKGQLGVFKLLTNICSCRR